MEIVELAQTPTLPASEWVWKYRGQTIPSPKSGRDPYLGPAIGWMGKGPFDSGARFEVENYGGVVTLAVDVGPREIMFYGKVFRKNDDVVLSGFSLEGEGGEPARFVYEGMGGDKGGLVPPEWEEDGWG